MRVRPTVDFARGLVAFKLPEPAEVVIRLKRDGTPLKSKLRGAAKRKGYGKFSAAKVKAGAKKRKYREVSL